jgi:hypothetical protein
MDHGQVLVNGWNGSIHTLIHFILQTSAQTWFSWFETRHHFTEAESAAIYLTKSISSSSYIMQDRHIANMISSIVIICDDDVVKCVQNATGERGRRRHEKNDGNAAQEERHWHYIIYLFLCPPFPPSAYNSPAIYPIPSSASSSSSSTPFCIWFQSLRHFIGSAQYCGSVVK